MLKKKTGRIISKTGKAILTHLESVNSTDRHGHPGVLQRKPSNFLVIKKVWSSLSKEEEKYNYFGMREFEKILVIKIDLGCCLSPLSSSTLLSDWSVCATSPLQWVWAWLYSQVNMPICLPVLATQKYYVTTVKSNKKQETFESVSTPAHSRARTRTNTNINPIGSWGGVYIIFPDLLCWKHIIPAGVQGLSGEKLTFIETGCLCTMCFILLVMKRVHFMFKFVWCCVDI